MDGRGGGGGGVKRWRGISERGEGEMEVFAKYRPGGVRLDTVTVRGGD